MLGLHEGKIDCRTGWRKSEQAVDRRHCPGQGVSERQAIEEVPEEECREQVARTMALPANFRRFDVPAAVCRRCDGSDGASSGNAGNDGNPRSHPEKRRRSCAGAAHCCRIDAGEACGLESVGCHDIGGSDADVAIKIHDVGTDIPATVVAKNRVAEKKQALLHGSDLSNGVDNDRSSRSLAEISGQDTLAPIPKSQIAKAIQQD